MKMILKAALDLIEKMNGMPVGSSFRLGERELCMSDSSFLDTLLQELCSAFIGDECVFSYSIISNGVCKEMEYLLPEGSDVVQHSEVSLAADLFLFVQVINDSFLPVERKNALREKLLSLVNSCPCIHYFPSLGKVKSCIGYFWSCLKVQRSILMIDIYFRQIEIVCCFIC